MREISNIGLIEQAKMVREGSVTSRELVERSLGTIERLDPKINAFCAVRAERALAEADAVQPQVGDEVARPLLGVPIAIKDDTGVAGEVTAVGTLLTGPPEAKDWEVVRRLRAAGAIVVGKTNLPELALWGLTESVARGITRNPWNLGRTPGGSSGGSAAAVAAGMVPAALGTDGAGSIRIPAACCGLFGLKPQRGRVSFSPKSERWYGLSTTGPITRSVADSALFYDAVRGPAPGDAATPPDPEISFLQAANSTPRKLRIGLTFSAPLPVKPNAEVARAVLGMGELLAAQGHDVEQFSFRYPFFLHTMLPRVWRGAYNEIRSLPPVAYDRFTSAVARNGRLFPEQTVAFARRAEAPIRRKTDPLFERFDVLLTPVMTEPAVPVASWRSRGVLTAASGAARWAPYGAVWNITGQPAASVPAGLSADGLPLAVQIVGNHNSEATLFSLAAQIEAAAPWADLWPQLATSVASVPAMG